MSLMGICQSLIQLIQNPGVGGPDMWTLISSVGIYQHQSSHSRCTKQEDLKAELITKK